ncbi:MAG: histidine phosphatase family protein [Chitinophagales bacterium]
MKELCIIRHAKSSWEDPALSDRERPLASKGIKDIPLVARELSAQGLIPDLVYSSPAVRAYTTAMGICSALGYPKTEIEKQECLYFGAMEEIIQCIRNTPERCKRLFLFGHNPTFSELSALLCPGFHEDMPTCAVAAIQFRDSWKEVQADSGKLLTFIYPGKLR